MKHKCISTKSNDGGSGGERIPCDGYYEETGYIKLGCGEPCRFAMGKQGEGEPPLPDNFWTSRKL